MRQNPNIEKQLIYDENAKMNLKFDLTDQVFGRLRVIEYVGKNQYGMSYWRCKCECGNEPIICGNSLRMGYTKSCGCYHVEQIIKAANKRQGIHSKRLNDHNARLYQIWINIRQQCTNPNNKKYSNHGGRGISVCDEWNTYENFYNWAQDHGYKKSLYLDRIDINKNYSPENCKWVSLDEKANHRVSTHYLTYDNYTFSVSEWANITGLPLINILYRLKKGWSLADTLHTPVDGKPGVDINPITIPAEFLSRRIG